MLKIANMAERWELSIFNYSNIVNMAGYILVIMTSNMNICSVV